MQEGISTLQNIQTCVELKHRSIDEPIIRRIVLFLKDSYGRCTTGEIFETLYPDTQNIKNWNHLYYILKKMSKNGIISGEKYETKTLTTNKRNEGKQFDMIVRFYIWTLKELKPTIANINLIDRKKTIKAEIMET